ncbi:MAG: glycosyltransferase family 39 protein [Chitinophagales bacterium]|nr:glycosyltransferase family 39 protein [Chitinophagales bacterium]
MKKHQKDLLLIIVIAFLVRLIWLVYTDNAGYGDAAARLNIAQIWLYSFWKIPTINYKEILNPSLDWLPLQFYFTGIVSFLFNDMTYAPRILPLLVAVATLIPLYKICTLKFDRNTATIAIVLLSFYGIHIFVSSLTLSEPYYFFFILWAYYCIEKHIKNGNEKDSFWALGLMLACCCLLRYEAWIFAPLVIIVLPTIRKMNVKSFLSLALLPTLAVGFIMACEVSQGQHPLRGILFSDFEVALSNKFYGAPDYTNLLASYLPLYLIAGLSFLTTTIRKKDYTSAIIFMLYLLPIMPFVFKLINGSVTTQARYLALYMIPGIVYIAHFINGIFQRFQWQRFGKITFLLCYLCIANFSLAKQIHENRLKIKYANGFKHSAYFMKDSVARAKAYVDYGEELSNCNWMVYANLYDAINTPEFIDSIAKQNHVNADIFIQRTIKGARYRITGHEYEWQTWSAENFNHLLENKEITHIVLFPKGMLTKYLHFSKPNETYRNKAFKQLFSEDGYMIYAIE